MKKSQYDEKKIKLMKFFQELLNFQKADLVEGFGYMMTFHALSQEVELLPTRF